MGKIRADANHNKEDFQMTKATAASPRTRGVEPSERPRHSRSVNLHLQRATEHVLFRYDPRNDPSITFYSLPHPCAGGAQTLDAARKICRSMMSGLLGVTRHELPRVVEHLEAVVADMWVRTEMGAVHRDPLSDRMLLQTLMSTGPAQDSMRADLLRAATNQGATPVVIILEPYDSVGTVLDQMRGADTVLVVHYDMRDVLKWVTIFGPNAEGAHDITGVHTIADLRTKPITFLTDTCVTGDRRAVRLQMCDLNGAA
jgi:hypothetical protein